MNHKKIWILFLIGILWVSACSANPPVQNSETKPAPTREPANSGTLVELTEEQNGGTVALAVNDRVSITIDGNPTTGFLWEVQNLDSSLLAQKGDPQYSTSGGQAGSAGNYTYTFQALKAGVTTLRLIYHRPFEKNTPPERIFEVSVDIQ